MVKGDRYFSDESARKDGVSKSIIYFDSKENAAITEFYYTYESVRQDSITKKIIYFDSNRKKMITERF